MRDRTQKRPVKNILTIFFTLVLLAGLPAKVSALTYFWQTLTLDSGDYKITPSLAVVNGKPAVSYYKISGSSLMFIRAKDAAGTVWGDPQIVDNGSGYMTGRYSSLAVVDGFPAISYSNESFGDLMFIRAQDVNGLSWGSRQTLDSSGMVGETTSLAIVSGNPAISYYDPINGLLKFIRANDASGSSWGSPQTLDGSSSHKVGMHPSLAVVNGFPAISYYDFSTRALTFIRASQPDGSEWNNAPQILDNFGNVGYYTSLTIVNGVPAVSYYDVSNGNLKFIRARDASGTLWNSPQTLDSGELVGKYTSLAVVNGIPAISYYDEGNGDLKFIWAKDADGSEWKDPQTLETSGTVGSFTSLAAVNEYPAISYFDESETALKYLYVQGAVDFSLLESSSPLNSGSTLDFGSTTLYTPVTRTLTLQNNGSLALDLNSLSLPAGFSFASGYINSIPAGDSAELQVRLDANSTGTFTGTLSIQNPDTENSPYTVTLNGTVTAQTLKAPLLSPVDGSTVLNSSLQVVFNQPVKSDGGPEAANNPANYLLVEAGVNAVFDTTTCAAGVEGDDVKFTIASVSYDSSSYIATITPETLTTGKYQLLVCGTASIEGLDGNVLNNGLYDSATTFTVISSSTGENSSSSALANLPATGFAPGQFTRLPAQPQDSLYSQLSDLSLSIPELDIRDLPILGVPQTESGWDVTWLTNAEIGWLNGTAFPTWEGNTVLTGHVTNASGQAGPFADLHELSYGDTVVLEAYGQTYTYEVRESILVLPNNLSSVMDSREHDWVTLLTCEYYNELSGEYLFRRVVRAVLVGVE